VMTIDPKAAAVVLIEYQNDFTTEGGVLHEAVSEVMEQTDVLAHTRDVVTAARNAGATVMHAPITSVEEHDNALKYDYPMFSQPMSADEFVKELSA